MEKVRIAAVMAVFICSAGSARATFHFSNRNSIISIGPQANFIVNKDINVVNGRIDVIAHEPNRVTGDKKITFQNGLLGNGISGSILSGLYSPLGNLGHDTIILQGTEGNPHRLTCEGGIILQHVEIKGTYNTIEGRPHFTYPIVFDGNPTTRLTLGIQNKLNQNIQLNGGTLVLADDLLLEDNALIEGPGTVELSGKTLSVLRTESPWSGDIFFQNAKDIVFHARTSLTGSWFFSGDGVINGNGCVLDLTSGGSIVVKPNTQLQINDVVIKGIGSDPGLGQFILEDESSKLVFSRVTVELESDYSTTMGTIYIDGSSTVLVKDHNWLFDEQGSLTVDGVTLWTDRAGALGSDGLGIRFGSPESDYYTSVASGTVKIMGSSEKDFDALESLVYSNSVAINHLDIVVSDLGGEDAHLMPGESLTFNTDQTLDGNGKTVVFCRSDQPQFVVAPGVTVTLKNIELLRINQNTFDMGAGSKLKIDTNVLFELSEDTTWQSGLIELIGENNVFTVRGIGGRKRFIFGQFCFGTTMVLDLGVHTMLLQNIELSGLSLCDGSAKLRDRYFNLVGSIALGGNAAIVVAHSTRMNIVVQGMNNELHLLDNNLALGGNLLFGDLSENELRIKFLLDDEMSVVRRVQFDNSFAFITSEHGFSRLIFDDPYVEVYNATANSFVVSDRSSLSAYKLKILNNPIKQVSPEFELAPGIELTSDLSNAIEQEFIRSPFKFGRPGRKITTSLKQLGASQIKEGRYAGAMEGCWKGRSSSADLQIQYNSIQLSNAKNSINMMHGTITEFGISSNDVLTLTMADGSTIQQKNADVVLKSGDRISIRGCDNKILVTNRLTIEGDLTIAQGAELTFAFDADSANPEVYFACQAEKVLTVAKDARIRFAGKGRVVFEDGYVIELDGQSGKNAEFVLQDSAQLALEDNGTLYLTGRGTFLVDDNARLLVGADQHMIVGLDASDSIAFLVDREGEVVVKSLDAAKRAILSFQQAAYGIDIMRKGRLRVGGRGLLEINLLDQQISRGILTHLSLAAGGIVQIDESGLWQIAENIGETPLLLDVIDGSVVSGGLIGFVGSSFTGVMQEVTIDSCELLAKSLVDIFVNQMPSLVVTILFTDALGMRKIRTKDGVIVALRDGDTILSENGSTGTLIVENDGEIFAINSQGERT